jgi:hypothetical protein
MRCMWEQKGPIWCLVPVGDRSGGLAKISVREDAPGIWNIYMGEFSLVPLNYNNAEAAKRDAWAYALRHRREYFGVYWKRSLVLEG